MNYEWPDNDSSVRQRTNDAIDLANFLIRRLDRLTGYLEVIIDALSFKVHSCFHRP